jgi:hypothetical protein
MIPVSTKMPALTGFQKTLRVSAFSAPPRLSPLFPHRPSEAFSGLTEISPKIII